MLDQLSVQSPREQAPRCVRQNASGVGARVVPRKRGKARFLAWQRWKMSLLHCWCRLDGYPCQPAQEMTEDQSEVLSTDVRSVLHTSKSSVAHLREHSVIAAAAAAARYTWFPLAHIVHLECASSINGPRSRNTPRGTNFPCNPTLSSDAHLTSSLCNSSGCAACQAVSLDGKCDTLSQGPRSQDCLVSELVDYATGQTKIEILSQQSTESPRTVKRMQPKNSAKVLCRV